MKRSSLIWIAAAIVLLTAAGYSAYWWYVAGRLDAGIDDWATMQRQAGLILDFERTPVRGFPFAFEAGFRNPHVAGNLAGQSFDWRGPDLEARVSPFDLTSITLSGAGRHQAALNGAAISFEAAALDVRLGFSAGMLSSVSAAFSGARLTLADGRTVAASTGLATLAAPAAPPKADGDPLLSFVLDAKDLQLPQGIVLLTADPLGVLQLSGTIKGPMPPAPLRQALAAWRDLGGTVDLSAFAAAQATLSLTGHATIALDAGLQPIVAADIQARGLGPTIDLLASQQRIPPEDALKLKLFVHGAERDAAGGGKEVATGLTVQGGYLSWGPFKLARLAPIDWP